MKKIRLFANRDRVTRTRIVYITLIAGTVLIAFLLVLLNRWIFRLSEAGLSMGKRWAIFTCLS